MESQKLKCYVLGHKSQKKSNRRNDRYTVSSVSEVSPPTQILKTYFWPEVRQKHR